MFRFLHVTFANWVVVKIIQFLFDKAFRLQSNVVESILPNLKIISPAIQCGGSLEQIQSRYLSLFTKQCGDFSGCMCIKIPHNVRNVFWNIRRNNVMSMIWHDDVRVEVKPFFCNTILQCIDDDLKIRKGSKNKLPVNNGGCDKVERNSGHDLPMAHLSSVAQEQSSFATGWEGAPPACRTNAVRSVGRLPTNLRAGHADGTGAEAVLPFCILL